MSAASARHPYARLPMSRRPSTMMCQASPGVHVQSASQCSRRICVAMLLRTIGAHVWVFQQAISTIMGGVRPRPCAELTCPVDCRVERDLHVAALLAAGAQQAQGH